MADGMTIKIEGGEEIAKMLAELGRVVSADILLDAGMVGAKALADAANGNAPGPNIKTAVEKKSGKSVEIAIGPDKEYWYYQFFETGATAHEIKPRRQLFLLFEGAMGWVRSYIVQHGGMPARPFLRPALDEKEEEVQKKIADRLWELILAKLPKKA